MQYTHSRLTSLVEAATVSLGDSDVTSIDTTSLQESIARELVYHIARYDEVLSISYYNHEPHHLVQYLFVLCNTASKALKVLQVKTAPDTTTAMARLLLFHCTRKTLGEGLTVLGIKPLDKM